MNKKIIIKIDTLNSINLAGILTNQYEFKGFPDDVKIDRIDYEPTSGYYYLSLISDTFPESNSSRDIPFINLDLQKEKGKKPVIFFNIYNRI